MRALARSLRGGLHERLGGTVTAYRILEIRDDAPEWLTVRFVMYNYLAVTFTYDQGVFGFGVEQPSISLGLLSSRELRLPLSEMEAIVAELDRRVRLRIPDKYLEWYEAQLPAT